MAMNMTYKFSDIFKVIILVMTMYIVEIDAYVVEIDDHAVDFDCLFFEGRVQGTSEDPGCHNSIFSGSCHFHKTQNTL